MRNAASLMTSLISETSKGYLGMPRAVETAVYALCGGLHLLIEDVSGVGKTTLVRCLAKASGMDLGRIQFTPDLLPGDITGMMIWDSTAKEFHFRQGPVHHQFVLADELNRSPARTQSALLEAMQEQTVTVDGVVRPLPEPFFVAATQNPAWYAGTYNLPESQLDRFGLSLYPGFPPGDTEARILLELKDKSASDLVSAVCGSPDITEIRKQVQSVHIEQNVLNYAVSIAAATRTSGSFQAGLSIRGGQHLLRAAQVSALAGERDFVIPEDILSMAPSVMNHRLVLTPEARSRGVKTDHAVKDVCSSVPVPVL